jgi:hypothetical protein
MLYKNIYSYIFVKVPNSMSKYLPRYPITDKLYDIWIHIFGIVVNDFININGIIFNISCQPRWAKQQNTERLTLTKFSKLHGIGQKDSCFREYIIQTVIRIKYCLTL